jgi:hypothetical protein
MAVHTANIICTISMFQLDFMGNDSNKEHKRREQILCHTVQIFRNNDQVGDAFPNILDSPPRAVQGHILIMGQHDETPQVFTVGQAIIHGVIQIHRDNISMYPPHDPEANSMATLFTVNVDQLLIIRNPEMAVAPFKEPDFLRLPRPTTPYKLYPGSPSPNFDYQPHTLIPELVEEPGVIQGDDWLHNVMGVSPAHSYTIPRLRGRMMEAPFYKYDFLPDYPKVLLL